MSKEITKEGQKKKNPNLSPQVYNPFQYEFLASLNYLPKSSGKNLYDDRTAFNKIINMNTNEKLMEEMKECTFKPKLNLNRTELNLNKLVPLTQSFKLNTDIKAKKNTKQESPSTQQKEIRVCTFSPKIISDKKYKNSQSPNGFEKSVSRLQKKSNLQLKIKAKNENPIQNPDSKSPKYESVAQKSIKIDININIDESIKQKSNYTCFRKR